MRTLLDVQRRQRRQPLSLHYRYRDPIKTTKNMKNKSLQQQQQQGPVVVVVVKTRTSRRRRFVVVKALFMAILLVVVTVLSSCLVVGTPTVTAAFGIIATTTRRRIVLPCFLLPRSSSSSSSSLSLPKRRILLTAASLLIPVARKMRPGDGSCRGRSNLDFFALKSSSFEHGTDASSSTTAVVSSSVTTNSSETLSMITKSIGCSILLFILQSLLVALLIITWEDVTCTYTLSSRHQRTSLQLLVSSSSTSSSQDGSSISDGERRRPWGWSTVRGLAFGKMQRLELIAAAEAYADDNAADDEYDDEIINSAIMPQLKSYNEVMLQHRQERVARWKEGLQQQQQSQQQSGGTTTTSTTATTMTSASAIHILCDCLQQVWKLRTMAENYQWNEIASQLRRGGGREQQAPSSFLTQLEAAASYLRTTTTSSSSSGSSSHIWQTSSSSLNNDDDKASVVRNVIGFDWGSCAWRGRNACGALADAEEALDQLDALTGLLEPYEAIFCLDIVERSIRDMLAVVMPLYQQQQQQQQQQRQYGNGAAGDAAAASAVFVYSQDVSFWQATANEYKPHRIFPPVDTKQGEFAMSESFASDQTTIDEDYLEAIQNLRLD